MNGTGPQTNLNQKTYVNQKTYLPQVSDKCLYCDYGYDTLCNCKRNQTHASYKRKDASHKINTPSTPQIL